MTYYAVTQTYDDGGSIPTKTKIAVFYGSFQPKQGTYISIDGKIQTEWDGKIYTTADITPVVGDYVDDKWIVDWQDWQDFKLIFVRSRK